MGHSEVWGPAGDKLLVVGMTGGIASGKTEVARALRLLGALVIDADDVARDVTLPGGQAYEPLLKEFGDVILDRSGRIDRAALASEVFGDEGKRRALNTITHPVIFAEIIRQVVEHADNLEPGDVPAAVVDAALIVDVGASSVFDILIVVAAEVEARVGRMACDRGMAEGESRGRIAAQITDSERLGKADLVIENNGTLDQLRSRVGEVWTEITKRSRALYG